MTAVLRRKWMVGEVGERSGEVRRCLPRSQFEARADGGGELGVGSSEKKKRAAALLRNSSALEGEEAIGRCGGEGKEARLALGGPFIAKDGGCASRAAATGAATWLVLRARAAA